MMQLPYSKKLSQNAIIIWGGCGIHKNFVEKKTFAGSYQTMKFVKDLSLENFLLCGSHLCHNYEDH